MSRFFSRHLRLFSALAVVPWLVILVASITSLVRSTLAFDDGTWYTASIVLGVAILLTTLVLVGVQARASEAVDSPIRGAGLIGAGAAVLAVAFVWFIPAWAALFIWAVAATVIRTRATDLTSPGMRALVLCGLGVFALAIPVGAFLNLTADMLGTTLWIALLVLSTVLTAWQVALALRTAPASGALPASPSTPEG